MAHILQHGMSGHALVWTQVLLEGPFKCYYATLEWPRVITLEWPPKLDIYVIKSNDKIMQCSP